MGKGVQVRNARERAEHVDVGPRGLLRTRAAPAALMERSIELPWGLGDVRVQW